MVFEDALVSPARRKDAGVFFLLAMQSRRLHPVDAVHGFGCFPTSILQSKMNSCIYSCPACAYSVKGFNLRNFRLRELLFRYSKFQNQVHHSCRQFQRKRGSGRLFLCKTKCTQLKQVVCKSGGHTCRVSFCRFCALQALSAQKSSPLL